MISYKDALQKVLEKSIDLSKEMVHIQKAEGRVLAEDICAARDYPPFNRVAMDGIAIDFSEWSKRQNQLLHSEGIQAAGSAQMSLENPSNCLEVMTGAVLPAHCDTVIPYEHLKITDNSFLVNEPVKQGQNVHKQGSDLSEGSVLMKRGDVLRSGSIALLATEGKEYIPVRALPKVALIATGDELVPINEAPLPHQIRSSNDYMIASGLKKWGIQAKTYHVKDNTASLEELVGKIIQDVDVCLFFGGVSKGKFDYLPDVFNTLGIQKIFHRVAQRPGKPMWFGSSSDAVLFALPGNPISSWACYQAYFIPWLKKSLGMEISSTLGSAQFSKSFSKPLTLFQLVQEEKSKGNFVPVENNGSGDLTSLHQADAFLVLDAESDGFEKDEVYRCITFE